VIKQDYILRLIEQLAQFLARILKLHERGEYDAAMSAIEDALRKLVGLDLRLVEALELEDLVALLKPGIDLDVSRCIVVADLLKARGDVRHALGDEAAATDSYVRSLTLFLEVFSGPGSIDLPEHQARAEWILGRLADAELPATTLVRLLRYHEKKGRYALAEDVLWELVDEHWNAIHFAAGVEFYERLRQKSASDLAAGGLPRDEVEEGSLRLQDLAGESSE
jgi:hypothetical protein